MPRARSQILRLRIDPVIENAEKIAARVRRELPTHAGIARAASGVAEAAHEAKRVADRLRRPWGLHRLPAACLALMLILFVSWLYWRFFYVATLTVAVPERDASRLHRQLATADRIRFQPRLTEGSRENVALLDAGDVDLAFVQGGVPVPDDLPRLETADPELVLLFVRQSVEHPVQATRILTSLEGQGSHSVARDLVATWQAEQPVQFVHDWTRLTGDPDYVVPSDVEAVLVVKDPASEQTLRAAQRLVAAGFRLASPELGARAASLEYLRKAEIPRAYFCGEPQIPDQSVPTYSVATYLVARRGLTPRLLASAAHLLDSEPHTLRDRGVEPTFSDAGDVLQAVEAFLGILVYIGLAFLMLLGIEVTTYRRRFHELNTLISLISIHQSEKDVLGLTNDDRRRENLLYLRICSDLLGLISVISGYYTQENSSLLYSNLLEIIHHRCSGLKLNIQTKILHASIVVAGASDEEKES